HIALALLLVEAGLRPGRSPPPQELGAKGLAAISRDVAGEDGGLVIAPPPEPEAMGWDRGDGVGCGEGVGAGAQQEPRHQDAGLMPVAVFERMREAARRIIEQERGAGAVPAGRIGKGCGTHRTLALVIGEWNGELLAEGRLDEGELRPAGNAEA